MVNSPQHIALIGFGDSHKDIESILIEAMPTDTVARFQTVAQALNGVKQYLEKVNGATDGSKVGMVLDMNVSDKDRVDADKLHTRANIHVYLPQFEWEPDFDDEAVRDWLAGKPWPVENEANTSPDSFDDLLGDDDDAASAIPVSSGAHAHTPAASSFEDEDDDDDPMSTPVGYVSQNPVVAPVDEDDDDDDIDPLDKPVGFATPTAHHTPLSTHNDEDDEDDEEESDDKTNLSTVNLPNSEDFEDDATPLLDADANDEPEVERIVRARPSHEAPQIVDDHLLDDEPEDQDDLLSDLKEPVIPVKSAKKSKKSKKAKIKDDELDDDYDPLTPRKTASDTDDDEDDLTPLVVGKNQRARSDKAPRAVPDVDVEDMEVVSKKRPIVMGDDNDTSSRTGGELVKVKKKSPVSDDGYDNLMVRTSSDSAILAKSDGMLIINTGSAGGTGKTTFSWHSANLHSMLLRKDYQRRGVPEEDRKGVVLIESDFMNPKMAARLSDDIPQDRVVGMSLIINGIRLATRKPEDRADIERRYITNSAIKLDDTGLLVIPATYDTTKRDPKEAARAISTTVRFYKNLGYMVYVDAPTISSTGDLLNGYLLKNADRVVLVGNPGDGLDDVRRAAKAIVSKTTAGGIGVAKSKLHIVMNRTSMDEYTEISNEGLLAPFQLAGNIEYYREWINKWAGNHVDLMDDNDWAQARRAILWILKVVTNDTVIDDWFNAGGARAANKETVSTKMGFFRRLLGR